MQYTHTSSDLLERFNCPLFLACFNEASDTEEEVPVLAADLRKAGLGFRPPPFRILVSSNINLYQTCEMNTLYQTTTS